MNEQMDNQTISPATQATVKPPSEEQGHLSRTQLYIVTAILSIAVLGLCGFIVWDHLQSDTTNTPSTTPSTETTETDEPEGSATTEENMKDDAEISEDEKTYVTEAVECEIPDYISRINTTYPEDVTIETEYQDNGTTTWSCKVRYSYSGATMTYWFFIGVDYDEGLREGYSTLTTLDGRELVRNTLIQASTGTWETGYGEYKGPRTCDPLEESPYPCPEEPYLYDREFSVEIPQNSYEDTEEIMTVFDDIVRKLNTE
jgi:nitrate reductase NapE component